MKRIMTVATIVLAVSVVFSGETPEAVNKYFAGWIPQLDFDSTNDCYVAQYNPASCQQAYVHTSKSKEYLKIQPGEYYAVTRGERTLFTQHAGGVGWSLTFTNGVVELNGVSLPAEFKDSNRQLLIEGNRALGYRVFEKYAFVVNAAGEAYDVTTRTKFHFGIPFHAPEDTSPPRIDRGVENIQQTFCKEGVEVHKKALSATDVMAMMNVVKEGVTNVVPFVEEIVGLNAEEARKCLRESNSDYAALIRKMESRKRQVDYVAFCTRENGSARIAAVARLGDGPKCRMWSYEGRGQVPTLIYSWTCQGRVGSYYEYSDNGLLRNLCLFKDGRITSYSTIRDGVLQKSPDMQKAQEFVSTVEEMFNRYVELDTTGKLKPFVEKLKAQAEEAKTPQKSKQPVSPNHSAQPIEQQF